MTKTKKINESGHSADILTKSLQGREFDFKRKRPLGLRAVPPAKPSSSATATTGAGEAEGRASCDRFPPSDPASGTWNRARPCPVRTLWRGRRGWPPSDPPVPGVCPDHG